MNPISTKKARANPIGKNQMMNEHSEEWSSYRNDKGGDGDREKRGREKEHVIREMR